MHTLNSWQTLLRYTLGAVLVGGMTVTAVNAVDGNPPGLFELDANTVDNAGGGRSVGSSRLVRERNAWWRRSRSSSVPFIGARIE